MNARITATAQSTPDNVMTNFDLEKLVDTIHPQQRAVKVPRSSPVLSEVFHQRLAAILVLLVLHQAPYSFIILGLARWEETKDMVKELE